MGFAPQTRSIEELYAAPQVYFALWCPERSQYVYWADNDDDTGLEFVGLCTHEKREDAERQITDPEFDNPELDFPSLHIVTISLPEALRVADEVMYTPQQRSLVLGVWIIGPDFERQELVELPGRSDIHAQEWVSSGRYQLYLDKKAGRQRREK